MSGASQMPNMLFIYFWNATASTGDLTTKETYNVWILLLFSSHRLSVQLPPQLA